MTTAPKGLKTAGRRLWKAVTGQFELGEHELAVLRQACRTVDICDELEALVAARGVLSETGAKVNPCLGELRLQRLLLGRLLVSLRIPLDDDEQRPGQHRSTRGFYVVDGEA